MQKLQNKKYASYDYLCRYTGVPYYYDPTTDRQVYGLGEQLKQDLPFVSHPVKPDDTLDSLALQYYNNPTYWWIIAYFNKITDPFIQISTKFTVIKIPSMSSIEFKNERV